MKPSDLISQLSSSSSKGNSKSTSINPNPNYPPSVGPSPYKQALLKLVNSSYLIPCSVLFHISPRDKLLQFEAEEKSKLKNFPTAKELRQAKEVAEARLKREQEDALKTGLRVSNMGN